MAKEGILVINKPSGMTSHDVVEFARKRLKIKQVGHAGTLDPIATGVLIILVGAATKLFEHFLGLEKEYLATLTLGARTTTIDSEGEIIERKDFGHVTKEMVLEAASFFIGEQMQTPPMVSALKHRGRRLYKIARSGGQIERKPRQITIKGLEVVKIDLPRIQFHVKCSRGTYIRQLAEDMAEKLDCLGYLSQIERQSVGGFHVKDALLLSQVDISRIQSYSAS